MREESSLHAIKKFCLAIIQNGKSNFDTALYFQILGVLGNTQLPGLQIYLKPYIFIYVNFFSVSAAYTSV
jgi:hypothetical protein